MVLLLAIVLVISRPLSATAFPYFAGGCRGDGPAVGAPHLDANVIQSSSIPESGTVITVDGLALDSETVLTLQPGTDYLLEARDEDQRMRGILMRLAADDGVATDGALLPDKRTQFANVCQSPIIGLTHTRNNNKKTMSGWLRLDQATNVTLDISIVYRNDADLSWFSYSQFRLLVQEGGVTTPPIDNLVTLPPTTAPTLEAATMALSDVPSDAPSDAPSSTPEESPTPVPTTSSIATSTTIPSVVPSTVPTIVRIPDIAPVFATTAPTSDAGPLDCTAPEAAMADCFAASLSEPNACDDCLAEAIPRTATDCGALSASLCAALQECPCGGCANEIEAYLDCAFGQLAGCAVECGNVRG